MINNIFIIFNIFNIFNININMNNINININSYINNIKSNINRATEYCLGVMEGRDGGGAEGVVKMGTKRLQHLWIKPRIKGVLQVWTDQWRIFPRLRVPGWRKGSWRLGLELKLWIVNLWNVKLWWPSAWAFAWTRTTLSR